jgi:hypothetical protein
MDKAEYKNEIYNIETIYVYDELIRIYKGNLLETTSIKVKLSEVKILSLYCVSHQREPLLSYHRFLQENLSLDLSEVWVDEYLKR